MTRLRVRGYNPLRRGFPTASPSLVIRYDFPSTPNAPERTRFGLFPFRSPLLRESLLFYFPPPT